MDDASSVLDASPAVDPAGAFRLDDQVALRPEPFGALAYNYRNRRLAFLRSPVLVELVRELGRHPSVASAMTAVGIAEEETVVYLTALEQLLEREVICADR